MATALSGKEKERVLETDSINLKTVMRIDGVDFRRVYSNGCGEIFNMLSIEAAWAAIMKELRNDIEPYVNYRTWPLLCDIVTRRGLSLDMESIGPIQER